MIDNDDFQFLNYLKSRMSQLLQQQQNLKGMSLNKHNSADNRNEKKWLFTATKSLVLTQNV